MSQALVSTPEQNCCVTPCDEVDVQNIAGPQGDSAYEVAVQGGFVGTEAEWLASIAGEDGQNAFTTTSANFTVPAELATVVISVVNSDWAAIGQVLYIQNAGWYRVTAIPGPTQLTVRNLEDAATSAYLENVAPATVIASGAKVCPGGLQGIPGTGSGDLISTNNLSDVANVTTSRSNLGLAIGTNVQAFNANLSTFAGIAPSANVQSILGGANYAAIRTLLSLVPGTDIQAFDAFLLSIATLGTAADRIIYTTAVNTAAEAIITAAGRALLDDLTAAAQRQTLEVLPRVGLLGSLIAVDLGVLGDTLIPIVGSTRYRVTHIIIENANASLATAMIGVFSSAGGIGTIAANQAVTGATAADKFVSLTISGIGLTDIFTGANLYFRVGTIQAAATCSVWVFGESFS